jgi:hypothetical protein
MQKKHFTDITFSVPVLISSQWLEGDRDSLSHLVEVSANHVLEIKSLASEACWTEKHEDEIRTLVGFKMSVGTACRMLLKGNNYSH